MRCLFGSLGAKSPVWEGLAVGDSISRVNQCPTRCSPLPWKNRTDTSRNWEYVSIARANAAQLFCRDCEGNSITDVVRGRCSTGVSVDTDDLCIHIPELLTKGIGWTDCRTPTIRVKGRPNTMVSVALITHPHKYTVRQANGYQNKMIQAL